MTSFFRRRKPKRDFDPRYDTPISPDELERDVLWIEPRLNSWGLRVLDCRPITCNLSCWTADPEIAEWFTTRRPDYGAQFIGQHPRDPRPFPVNLSYPMTADPEEGAVFYASAMEEKWDIFFYADTIYFARSWTGQLTFRAPVVFRDQTMFIAEAESSAENGYDTEFNRRMLDFLIKSHMYGWAVPAPVPAKHANDPQAMALTAFSLYGLMAPLATTEDTTQTRHGGIRAPGEPPVS